MKKIFYLFAITAFILTSCNPLEDINTEIDALTANDALVDDLVITLTDEDYVTLDLSFGNFSSNDDAKNMIPGFLTDMYPQLGVNYLPNGEVNQSSSALVTYKLYSPISKTNYTVTAQDYTTLGSNNLTTGAELNSFLSAKYPSSANGSIVTLTYNSLAPQIEYTVKNSDFSLVGNGTYNNFDIRVGRAEETLEVRRAKIETILLNNFPNSASGQQYLVTYATFDGAAGTRQMLVQLTASNTYKLINGYTLTTADFALVGNGNYNNFDIRSGKDEETVEVRRAKIETILLANFTAAVAGDQYFVTYAVFDGAAGKRNMLLEFNGSTYDLMGATIISKTAKFVYTGNWAAPLTFTPAEYTLMGNSFANFSGDITEAERKMGVYLKSLFPFSAADDFKSVQYDFYNGSSTSARNTNFVYNGSVWNAIPTVINTSLKFGHNGTTWVPDNTIKYILTDADFTLVGNGRYYNFDIRAGKAEETIEVRLVKLNIILKNNFPNSEQGQKFSVTYATYDGTNGTRTTNVILEGSNYILQ